jgi:aminoglycoside 3-N-acetyltransferase
MEKGQRVFDVRHTKSCVGTLTETFRALGGVHRSLHPTHSVAAFGPLADWLVSGHEDCLTPCGAGTPYAKLLERDGRILFMGAGLQSNTAFHTVEALADLSYLMRKEPDLFTIVDAAGQASQKLVRRHQAGVPRRFAELEDYLVSRRIARNGRVGEANCLLLEGKRFSTCLMKTLEQLPEFLLVGSSQTSAPPLQMTP